MLIRQLKTEMAIYSVFEHWVSGVKVVTRETMPTEFAERWKAQFYGAKIALKCEDQAEDNK